MVRRFLILCGIAALGVTVLTSTASSRPQGTVSGAGSTFIQPLVSLWSPAYESKTGTKVNYNGVGSGAGIQAISNRQVDFGASDAPMTSDQFVACHGCVQIPWVLSATSVPYNVNGVSYGLKMTGPLLADMFLGKVTKWNDRRIKQLNPGVNLPDLKITPIYRSDSSGTTYNFTDYLSQVSSGWRSTVGRGTQVNFPTGIGAPKSLGVAGALSRTNGGITYVDVAYSIRSKFKILKLKNRAGRFALPGIRGIQAAAATVKSLPSNNELSIVNPPKTQKLAYPICTFSYVILPLKTANASELKRFVGWGLTTGQTFGQSLLFVPIPNVVKTKAQSTLKKIHT